MNRLKSVDIFFLLIIAQITMCTVKAHCDNPMENYHPAALPLSYKQSLSIFQLAILAFRQTNVPLWLSRELLSSDNIICSRQSRLATSEWTGWSIFSQEPDVFLRSKKESEYQTSIHQVDGTTENTCTKPAYFRSLYCISILSSQVGPLLPSGSLL